MPFEIVADPLLVEFAPLPLFITEAPFAQHPEPVVERLLLPTVEIFPVLLTFPVVIDESPTLLLEVTPPWLLTPDGTVGAVGAVGALGGDGAVGAVGAVGAIGVTGDVMVDSGAGGGVGAAGALGGVGAVGAVGAVGGDGGVGAVGAVGAVGGNGGVGNASA